MGKYGFLTSEPLLLGTNPNPYNFEEFLNLPTANQTAELERLGEDPNDLLPALYEFRDADFVPDMSVSPPTVASDDVYSLGVKPVDTNIAKALESSSSTRSRMMDEVNSKIEALKASRLEAQKSALEAPGLSSTDAIGTGISAALPLILGAVMAGRKGALMGGQAGMAGAAVGLKGMQADAAKRQELSKLKAKELASEQTKMEQNKFQLSRDDANALDKVMLKGMGGGVKGADENYRAKAAEQVDLLPLTDEQKRNSKEMILSAPDNSSVNFALSEARRAAKESSQSWERQGTDRVTIAPGERPSADDAKKKGVLESAAREITDVRMPRVRAAFTEEGYSNQDKIAALDQLTTTLKTLYGDGANFTWMEKSLRTSGYPGVAGISAEQMWDWFQKEVQGGTSPTQLINRVEQDAMDAIGAKLRAHHYILLSGTGKTSAGSGGGFKSEREELEARRALKR